MRIPSVSASFLALFRVSLGSETLLRARIHIIKDSFSRAQKRITKASEKYVLRLHSLESGVHVSVQS